MDTISHRVLLVEDAEDNYLCVRDWLGDITTTAYDLEWVSSIHKARESLASQQYDVCLVNCHTDAASGEGLVRALGRGKTPFILLTSHEDYEADVAATKAGASDYLVLGQVTPSLLERSIRYAVERKASESALLHAQRFAQATVDALPDNVAVIDEQGTIVAVNSAWRKYAALSGFKGTNSGVGMNYLKVCDQCNEEDARAAAHTIRTVIAGQERACRLEYPCYSPTAEAWYQISSSCSGHFGISRTT
ncbi:MAG: response regulator, partial [Cytophagaceae bacterium]